MTNHIHLVAVPRREDSLALALRDAHTVYAMHFNARTNTTGHVWQGRFYSCPLDDTHLWCAIRYVERNPVRAGLVERSEQYRWSSAAAHCGTLKDPLLSPLAPRLHGIADWSNWLAIPDNTEACETVRRRTNSGRPCGCATFVEQIEGVLNRILHPQKGGRPKKVEKGNKNP